MKHFSKSCEREKMGHYHENVEKSWSLFFLRWLSCPVLSTTLPESLFPMQAYVENESDIIVFGDFTFQLINDDTQVEITKYNDNGGVVEILSSIEKSSQLHWLLCIW